MTPHDLIAAFDDLAVGPDGVKRLRELVLQLAVRGKLVPQHPSDEPASKLLARIEKAAGSRHTSRVAAQPDEDVPFGIPDTWQWCSVQACTAYVRRGKSPSYADGTIGIPVVSQKCVQWSGFDLSKARIVTAKSAVRYEADQFLREGDLLWNSTGLGTLGRIIPYAPDQRYPKVVADSHVTILRPLLVAPRYLWQWLAGPYIQAEINDLATGSTKQTELSTKTILARPVPLPPLAEQHRIVAKVDELMAFLDKLEAAKNARDVTRTALRDAALAGLRNADVAEDVEVAWGRIAGQMDDLFAEPGDVGPLRQAVLELAVQGRLVRQDAGDKALENHAGQGSGSSTRRRPRRSPVGQEDQPDIVGTAFSLPPDWQWISLGAVASKLDYGTSAKSSDAGAVPVLRMGNLQGGRIDWTNLKYTSDPDEIAKYRLAPNSVLFNRTNSPELVGKTALYCGEREAIFAGYLIRIQTDSRMVPAFLNVILNAPIGRKWAWATKTDGVSQSNISASKLADFVVPLPPLAEQHRIVTKFDELMALLDQLEARLREAKGLQGAFAAAAVHHLDVDAETAGMSTELRSVA